MRQLLSTLKVLLALADDGNLIRLEDLPEQFHLLARPVAPQSVSVDMLTAIRNAKGNISLAAKRLGISRSTLYRKMENIAPRADKTRAHSGPRVVIIYRPIPVG